MKKELKWNKGPANGGTGTYGEDNGVGSRWWNGEKLLIVIDLENGRNETHLVIVSADGDNAYLKETLTEDIIFDFTFDDISWWARIEKENLPDYIKK